MVLGGCGATAGLADGGGTGGRAGSGGRMDGSSGGAGGALAVDGGGAGDGGDPCASLAGHTFISVNLLNCNAGINPQAPPCNWSISFTAAGGFSYSEGGADVPIIGTYVCAGGSITGTATYSALVFQGSYGGPGSELVWDNQRFHS